MNTDASQPIHPRQLLSPGWYWAFVDNNDAGAQALTQFTAANKGYVFITRTEEGEKTGLIFKDKSPYVWVLFEVRGKTVTWTLPGFPTKATKAAQTKAADILGDEHRVPAVTSPEHPFNKFFGLGWLTGEGTTDGSFANNPLAQAGDTLRTVLKVVLYGGAAIVLFQLFSATGGAKTLLGAFESKGSGGGSPSPRRLPSPSRTRLALPAG